MIELPQRRVRLASGIELDTVDLGPRDAPALIFLHGFPESHRTWRHQIAHFSDRYRCIAPDQRGYRGSSKPKDVSDYAGAKLVNDVFQLADALDVARFTVIGHDWGGLIAWGAAVAGQLTGRVRAAAIANAPHPRLFPKLVWTNPEQRAASQYIRELRDPANDPLVREHGLAGILGHALRRGAPKALDAEEQALLLADWQDRDSAFAMLNWYRAARLEVPPTDAPQHAPDEVKATFPKVFVPTLVVWGMDDFALLPANLEGLGRVVEDLTIVEVPDCGHFVPWEAPEAVNAALEDFLAR